MKTITEAKKLWKSKPYDDSYINKILNRDDSYWNKIIIGAQENEKNLNQYLVECKSAGLTTSKEDLAFSFLTQLVDYHKSEGISKELIVPSIMLMSNWISDIWIGYEMIKNMKVYKLK